MVSAENPTTKYLCCARETLDWYLFKKKFMPLKFKVDKKYYFVESNRLHNFRLSIIKYFLRIEIYAVLFVLIISV